MSFKVYRGSNRRGKTSFRVHDYRGSTQLEHVVRHSPDGMNWGYGGSGPSDLARSILIDHVDGEEQEKVEKAYQLFKFDFLASCPETGFRLTSDQIDDWLEAVKSKL